MKELIVIEGVDGTGKETQSRMLAEKLKTLGHPASWISFPRYDSPSSSFVKMYLNGDFGKNPLDVNAKTASMFYALDRYAAFQTPEMLKIRQSQSDILICDRYTTSNLIHQASKTEGGLALLQFCEWLKDLEYNILHIPCPTLVIFLDMPLSYQRELIEKRKNKITGEDKKDIHEKDMNFMQNSYDSARGMAKREGWQTIECVKDGELRTPEDIHEEILSIVISKIENEPEF